MEAHIKKNWYHPSVIPAEIEHNLSGFDPLMRQILYNRGLVDNERAQAFLTCEKKGSLDPFQLTDMDAAIQRIEKAIHTRESIAIYGDYDVDGVTATLVMVEVLQALGARVCKYIPNRYEEGYGLNIEALQSLISQGVNLVITVDCGARSFDEAEFAFEHGLDLIVSDHHQTNQAMPHGIPLINPKQPGDAYPEKDLTGVGLAFKIAQALELKGKPIQAENWLDLVALGTVADMAPIIGENRWIVKQGLERIHQDRRQGLSSLIRTASLVPNQVDAADIGFRIDPRLNAAGRIESAEEAYELLATADVAVAGRLAQELERKNYERQKMTQEIQMQAAEKARTEHPNDFLIFASDPNFSEGILGLAAARLVETYHRPAIVAHAGESTTRASCRSIPEFNITEALDECADLLVQYGGHRGAAGFTVVNENLPALIGRLVAIAEKKLGAMENLQPKITIDADVDPLLISGDDFRKGFEDLEALQPFGIGNPTPILYSSQLLVKQLSKVGKESNHLRLKLVNQNGVTFDGIAFWQGDKGDQIKVMDHIDLVYTLEKNNFRGLDQIQFNIKDIHLAGEEATRLQA